MKIDCVRFFVEDANVLTHWLINVLGFESVRENINYPWLEKTCTENSLSTHTKIVKSGSVSLIVSSSPSFNRDHDVGKYLQKHPPGVGEISFLVDDIDSAIARVQNHGVKILTPLQQIHLDHQQIRWIKIAAWGSLQHILVERRFVGSHQRISENSPSLLDIDHIVMNVPAGELTPATKWYQDILGLQPQQSFKIQTEKSGLCSQVMMSQCGNVQIPINEPTTPNSQIQEFINANNGAGIQHIALRLPNLIQAIAKFRQRGLNFISVPTSYYTNLIHRRGFSFSQEDLTAIAQQKILVDWHEDKPLSPLLQIFTQPIFDQPTFFFEFIERRRQAQGFGEGNFRALFTAIESEQAKRGTLD